MIQHLRAAAAVLLTALATGGCSPPSAPPAAAGLAPAGAELSAAGSTTIFVVRHAERASATDRDPPLSRAGHERAHALAEVLADAGVEAVFATQYLRTRETAAPLALRLGVPVTIDSVTSADASSLALARRVLSEHRGGTVLVVGHSNTVARIVRALGGTEMPDLEDSEYDRIFTVTVHPDGRVRTVRARFGDSR